MRFVITLKSVLLSIFISTVFFSVYFPANSLCGNHTHTNPAECLSIPSSILSGETECTWNSETQECSLRPPPSSPAFIISVAILTACVFSPLDLIFYFVLNMVCSKTPELEKIGLDRFFWLGAEGVTYSVANHNPDELDRHSHFVLRALRSYELRLEDGACSEIEKAKTRMVLDRYGLVERNQKVVLSPVSSLLYGSVGACVRARMEDAMYAAHIVAENMRRYKDESTKESYLIQYFTMEQVHFIARISLRRHFCHYETELPTSIHPIVWACGWICILAFIVFFIYWILAWGDSNASMSLNNWGINIVLHFIEEMLLLVVIRIFIINILVIEIVRPILQRLYNRFLNISGLNIAESKRRASSLNEGGLATNLSLLQFISPTGIVSRDLSFKKLVSAQVINSIGDLEMYYLSADDLIEQEHGRSGSILAWNIITEKADNDGSAFIDI